MIDGYLVLNHGDPRPDAERIVFCDGSGGSLFREGSDLELSHWRPNRTPDEYRAGTSTEICFRFLDAPKPGRWSLAINNHLDVDGLLSVYVLIHPVNAQAHRTAIIQAAEIGDFWGWGEPPAQRLFQGLTQLMAAAEAGGIPLQQTYERAFTRVIPLIEGTDDENASIEASLTPLRDGVRQVEEGDIRRLHPAAHFAQYIIPAAVAEQALEQCLYIPAFNEAISSRALLWPSARAKWDGQRACLVSVESRSGWYHDLWAPGYLWADTQGLWTFPGLQFDDGMQRYELDNPPLLSAVQQLQRAESSGGRWSLGERASPFQDRVQSIFPVILRVMDDIGGPALSELAPDFVAQILRNAITESG